MGQKNDKLFATISCKDIRFSGLVPHELCKFPHYLVSCSMTIGIIYFFKVINVEHHAAQRHPVPFSPAEFLIKPVVKVSNIINSCQVISYSKPIEIAPFFCKVFIEEGIIE